MKKLKFLFCVHGRLLPGSPQELYDRAYQEAYLPFIRVLEAHPQIKMNLHFSGALFDWLDAGHQGYLELVRNMVKSRQIELVGGAYHEPILPLIPDHDKIGQIKMLSAYLQKHFGYAPRGAFLPEGVWEPSLPKPLAKAGIEFAVLDEACFTSAGAGVEKINGYFLTEDQDYKLKVFPADEILWSLIPFKKPNEAIDYLQDLVSDDPKEAVCLQTALENFGLVAGSHKWVYQEKYLDRLFSLFEKNSSWLEPVVFSDYLDEFPPRGKIYLPCPVEAEGYYRNFLNDPQAAALHNKAYLISGRLRSVKKGRNLIGDQKSDENLRLAEVELYKGQGMTADFNDPNMRRELYSHLIKADRSLELSSRGERPFVDVLVSDLDNDDREEAALSNNLVNLFFAPSRGGELYELDYKPKAVNLADVKSAQNNFGLTDCFIDAKTDPVKFKTLENKGDFIGKPYRFLPGRDNNEISLLLKREGRVNGQKLALAKKITLCANQSLFTIDYSLENLSDETIETLFGIEFGLSLGLLDPDRAHYRFSDKEAFEGGIETSGMIKGLRQWNIIDAALEVGVLFGSEEAAALWVFPVRAADQLQGCGIFPNWELKLEPRKTWKNRLVVRIEE